MLGFTIECAHSFQPPWAEAEHVIREVSAGLLALAAEVAAPVADQIDAQATGGGRAPGEQQRRS